MCIYIYIGYVFLSYMKRDEKRERERYSKVFGIYTDSLFKYRDSLYLLTFTRRTDVCGHRGTTLRQPHLIDYTYIICIYIYHVILLSSCQYLKGSLVVACSPVAIAHSCCSWCYFRQTWRSRCQSFQEAYRPKTKSKLYYR